MKSPLTGKVVVVSGGSGLIGRNFAAAILASGGTAVITDVNIGALNKVTRELEKLHGRGRLAALRMDITSEKSIGRVIAAAAKRFGRIDAVVNAAYPRTKSWGKPFESVSYKEFCDNVNLQLGGAFLVSRQFGVFFKTQKRGHIINLSSIYGVVAPRFEIYGGAAFHGNKMTMPIEYAAIKSAIIHMTRYMAKYFKGLGVRANCITPGGIFDNQPKEFLNKYNFYGLSKGMLDQSDLNGALIFLLSDSSKHVNGQNIIVDDGWTL
jgi:NAD(P)-dependent dehydrogenase (short-subunit alcohol dehydrogenase family)